jgi:hypothetical protein
LRRGISRKYGKYGFYVRNVWIPLNRVSVYSIIIRWIEQGKGIIDRK